MIYISSFHFFDLYMMHLRIGIALAQYLAKKLEGGIAALGYDQDRPIPLILDKAFDAEAES